jgi:hypothetical protein
MLIRCSVVGVIVLASASAFAQDPDLSPNFGSAALQTGFMPDPQSVEIIAGGPNAASEIDPACAGYIADSPDFVLTYTAGSQYDLTIFAESPADTTMVIRAPDGTWHCNDDADGLNPAIGFADPETGDYAIWVGTYFSGEFPPAILSATELVSVTGSSAVAGSMPETDRSSDDAEIQDEAPAEDDEAASEDEPADDGQADADQADGDQSAPK